MIHLLKYTKKRIKYFFILTNSSLVASSVASKLFLDLNRSGMISVDLAHIGGSCHPTNLQSDHCKKNNNEKNECFDIKKNEN
jgi:hypothetical protein